MNHLGATLAAWALRDGHAYRLARFRHRRLSAQPLALVLWQLGAEPFTAAAVGFGEAPSDRHLVVAGDPRNRELAFAALLPFARWFCEHFEAPAARREILLGLDFGLAPATAAPQVVVANSASVEMLGRLGRRLAYLPVDGPRPAHPQLVRLGQHLLFLYRHASRPGQQLLVAMTELLADHWATPQSDLERGSLAALDAYIDPGRLHGFMAAAAAEQDPLGPVPDRGDDVQLEPLLGAFNERRSGRTDAATVRPLLAPIVEHYRPLVRRTWDLMWRCFERELEWPEAASVGRRWTDDRDAYLAHIDWIVQNGHRRTRQTPRQAARTLRWLEGAKERLRAEEACDDPVRMIPYLLDNKAVEGQVVQVNLQHYERARVQRVRRPLLTLLSPDPCPIPRGRELWWSSHPRGAPWVVRDVASHPAGALVTLKLTTSTLDSIPDEGEYAVFSVHHVEARWQQVLPNETPWTHQPGWPTEGPDSIETDELQPGVA